MRNKPLKTSVLRSLATALVVVFSAQNTVLIHAAEANIWAERRRARTTTQSQKDNRLQQLAKAQPTSAQSAQLAALPKLDPSLALPLTGKALSTLGVTSDMQFEKKSAMVKEWIPEWMQTAILSHATIQNIDLAENKDAKTILLFQDAHMHYEAQKNIATSIESLAKALEAKDSELLVGLEAADAANFDFSEYERYPHKKELREAADALLKLNVLSGPEFAAIAYDSKDLPMKVIGVESKLEYDTNVKALKASVPLKKEAEAALAAFKKELVVLKKKYYDKRLYVFDSKLNGFQDHSISVPEYVLYLDGIVPATGSNSRDLIEAALLEGSIDFKKVETERAIILRTLVAKMSDAEIKELLQLSTLYRSGQVSYSGYYDYLKKLSKKHGVNLTKYAEMNLYIQYVLKSEGIDASALFDEVRDLEKGAQEVLFKTWERRSISDLTKDFHLLTKLMKHELTEDEWMDYIERQNKVRKIPNRLTKLGQNVPASIKSMVEKWTVFEDFYRSAIDRNATMAKKLTSRLEKEKTETAVLVAGGFHTDGLVRELKQYNVHVLTVSPKMTSLGDGLSSLDFLAEDRTPLSQLFVGQKLFLAMQRPTADPAEQQTLLQSLYAIAGGIVRGTFDRVVVGPISFVLTRIGSQTNSQVTNPNVTGDGWAGQLSRNESNDTQGPLLGTVQMSGLRLLIYTITGGFLVSVGAFGLTSSALVILFTGPLIEEIFHAWAAYNKTGQLPKWVFLEQLRSKNRPGFLTLINNILTFEPRTGVTDEDDAEIKATGIIGFVSLTTFLSIVGVFMPLIMQGQLGSLLNYVYVLAFIVINVGTAFYSQEWKDSRALKKRAAQRETWSFDWVGRTNAGIRQPTMDALFRSYRSIVTSIWEMEQNRIGQGQNGLVVTDEALYDYLIDVDPSDVLEVRQRLDGLMEKIRRANLNQNDVALYNEIFRDGYAVRLPSINNPSEMRSTLFPSSFDLLETYYVVIDEDANLALADQQGSSPASAKPAPKEDAPPAEKSEMAQAFEGSLRSGINLILTTLEENGLDGQSVYQQAQSIAKVMQGNLDGKTPQYFRGVFDSLQQLLENHGDLFLGLDELREPIMGDSGSLQSALNDLAAEIEALPQVKAAPPAKKAKQQGDKPGANQPTQRTPTRPTKPAKPSKPSVPAANKVGQPFDPAKKIPSAPAPRTAANRLPDLNTPQGSAESKTQIPTISEPKLQREFALNAIRGIRTGLSRFRQTLARQGRGQSDLDSELDRYIKILEGLNDNTPNEDIQKALPTLTALQELMKTRGDATLNQSIRNAILVIGQLQQAKIKAPPAPKAASKKPGVQMSGAKIVTAVVLSVVLNAAGLNGFNIFVMALLAEELMHILAMVAYGYGLPKYSLLARYQDGTLWDTKGYTLLGPLVILGNILDGVSSFDFNPRSSWRRIEGEDFTSRGIIRIIGPIMFTAVMVMALFMVNDLFASQITYYLFLVLFALISLFLPLEMRVGLNDIRLGSAMGDIEIGSDPDSTPLVGQFIFEVARQSVLNLRQIAIRINELDDNVVDRTRKRELYAVISDAANQLENTPQIGGPSDVIGKVNPPVVRVLRALGEYTDIIPNEWAYGRTPSPLSMIVYEAPKENPDLFNYNGQRIVPDGYSVYYDLLALKKGVDKIIENESMGVDEVEEDEASQPIQSQPASYATQGSGSNNAAPQTVGTVEDAANLGKFRDQVFGFLGVFNDRLKDALALEGLPDEAESLLIQAGKLVAGIRLSDFDAELVDRFDRNMFDVVLKTIENAEKKAKVKGKPDYITAFSYLKGRVIYIQTALKAYARAAGAKNEGLLSPRDEMEQLSKSLVTQAKDFKEDNGLSGGDDAELRNFQAELEVEARQIAYALEQNNLDEAQARLNRIDELINSKFERLIKRLKLGRNPRLNYIRFLTAQLQRLVADLDVSSDETTDPTPPGDDPGVGPGSSESSKSTTIVVRLRESVKDGLYYTGAISLMQRFRKVWSANAGNLEPGENKTLRFAELRVNSQNELIQLVLGIAAATAEDPMLGPMLARKVRMKKSVDHDPKLVKALGVLSTVFTPKNKQTADGASYGPSISFWDVLKKSQEIGGDLGDAVLASYLLATRETDLRKEIRRANQDTGNNTAIKRALALEMNFSVAGEVKVSTIDQVLKRTRSLRFLKLARDNQLKKINEIKTNLSKGALNPTGAARGLWEILSNNRNLIYTDNQQDELLISRAIDRLYNETLNNDFGFVTNGSALHDSSSELADFILSSFPRSEWAENIRTFDNDEVEQESEGEVVDESGFVEDEPVSLGLEAAGSLQTTGWFELIFLLTVGTLVTFSIGIPFLDPSLVAYLPNLGSVVIIIAVHELGHVVGAKIEQRRDIAQGGDGSRFAPTFVFNPFKDLRGFGVQTKDETLLITGLGKLGYALTYSVVLAVYSFLYGNIAFFSPFTLLVILGMTFLNREGLLFIGRVLKAMYAGVTGASEVQATSSAETEFAATVLDGPDQAIDREALLGRLPIFTDGLRTLENRFQQAESFGYNGQFEQSGLQAVFENAVQTGTADQALAVTEDMEAVSAAALDENAEIVTLNDLTSQLQAASEGEGTTVAVYDIAGSKNIENLIRAYTANPDGTFYILGSEEEFLSEFANITTNRPELRQYQGLRSAIASRAVFANVNGFNASDTEVSLALANLLEQAKDVKPSKVLVFSARDIDFVLKADMISWVVDQLPTIQKVALTGIGVKMQGEFQLLAIVRSQA